MTFQFVMNSIHKLRVIFYVLGLYFQTISSADFEYDFIVVGAGASGAACAARLSEQGRFRVLLLEAGGTPLYVTTIPYFASGPSGGPSAWNFITEPQEFALDSYVNRQTLWPRGKVLGGTTTINGMFFTRGNQYDYDGWRDMGNEGWGWEDVLPLFKKLEDYQGPLYQESDRQYHGYGGPMTVSQPPYRSNLVDPLLDSAQAIGLTQADYNTPSQTGFTYPVFSIRNGTHCSTYCGYLQPILNRKNLHIMTYANVTHVLFDKNKRATGVRYMKNGKFSVAYATKEIILSAGPIKTPQILMLSGVGPKETLDQFKIPIVADVPGVGQNLHDHPGVLGLVFTANPDIGINPRTDATSENMELWETQGLGPFSVPFRVTGLGFVNSRFANASIDHPDIDIMIYQPPAAVVGLKPEVMGPAFVPKENKAVIITFPIYLRPKSRGFMTIRSTNPFDQPVLDPRYLSDETDIEVLLEGVKITYQLMQQQPLKDVGVEPLGSVLPGCVNFKQYSDDYFRCQIRGYLCTGFHPVGTCKMGPDSDRTAVVDPQLRVRGVTNLRVIDSSIFPVIPTGHPMVPSIMVGEKGAEMIKQAWRNGRNPYVH